MGSGTKKQFGGFREQFGAFEMRSDSVGRISYPDHQNQLAQPNDRQRFYATLANQVSEHKIRVHFINFFLYFGLIRG